MATAQSVIEDMVIDILAHTGPCTMDDMVQALPAYNWSEVFSAVDDMSRDGRVVLRRHSIFAYQLSLPASRALERPVRKRPAPVSFCVGCGYLCDEINPGDGQSPWIEAHRYLKQYRLTWIELDRNDGFCPACARVQACCTPRSPRATATVAR